MMQDRISCHWRKKKKTNIKTFHVIQSEQWNKIKLLFSLINSLKTWLPIFLLEALNRWTAVKVQIATKHPQNCIFLQSLTSSVHVYKTPWYTYILPQDNTFSSSVHICLSSLCWDHICVYLHPLSSSKIILHSVMHVCILTGAQKYLSWPILNTATNNKPTEKHRLTPNLER